MKVVDRVVSRIFLSNDWIDSYNYNFKNPTFLYMPWIKFHGDKLVGQINISKQYDIEALHIMKDFDPVKRKKLSKFSRRFPVAYKRMLLEHLEPICLAIKGLVFTFDWHPAMRILSEVCEELNIPRILVLHESVFIDQSKYYTDILTHENTPLAEHIICWGDLQRDIFLSRGIDKERLTILGAPKFDRYHNFQASITKKKFLQTYAFENNKKVILFALQPMDMQVDEKEARAKQLLAVNDLMDYCVEYNCQLVLRMPPARIELLDEATLSRVDQEKRFICDGLNAYLINAEESIFYSDVIVSINSTMLFEAVLMNKVVLSTKYIEFEQIWEKIGLPFVQNKEGLYKLLPELMQEGLHLDPVSWRWAENNLSAGCFDGRSAQRICSYLENLIKVKS